MEFFDEAGDEITARKMLKNGRGQGFEFGYPPSLHSILRYQKEALIPCSLSAK